MKITPFSDNVLVKAHKVEEKKTETGIYIPTTASFLFHRGTVVAVGPEAAAQVKEGDTVIYDIGRAMELEETDEHGAKLLIISEDHLLAKVSD